MANLEELVVSLVAETSGLRAELNNATKATQAATGKMDDALAEFSKNSSKNVGFFQTAMATMTGFLAADAVNAVIGFVKDGLDLMGDALKQGVDDAIAEEQALKRLANSMAVSGQYTADAMKSLQEFSGEMERTTGVQDDVVAGNLALLSSLTKLDAEGLKAAQKAALDFSAATGKDLETATQMVAKSINGSTDAFKKMGINIVETNDKASALTFTVNALNKQFGGAAVGAAQTFQGAVTGLNNSWGNFAESLATTITKNPVVIAMLGEMAKILTNLTTGADNSSVALREGLGKSLIFVTDSIGVLALMADTAFKGLYSAIAGLKIGLDSIVGGVNWLADKFGIIKDEDPFKALKATAEDLDSTLTQQSTLEKVAESMANIGVAGENAFSKIASASDTVTPSVAAQSGAVQGLNKDYETLLQTFAKGLADQGMALDSQYQYENELRAVQLETELAQLDEHSTAKYDLMTADFEARTAALQAQQDAEWQQLETAHANNLLSDQQYNAAKTALAQQQYLATKKLEADKTKAEDQEQKTRLSNLNSTFGAIATLSSSSSKELAAIGKAAAIAQATIDGYAAVQKALASAPPPFNFALAALVGVATAANIAKIAGVGLRDGGTIAGGGANMDTVPATLTKGETVITRDLTDKLAEFLNGNTQGGGGGQVTVEITLKDQLVEFVETKIVERQAANISLLGATT